MLVRNVTVQVSDRRYQRRLEDPRGIMLHRIGVDLKQGIVIGHDAISICDAFRGRNAEFVEVGEATGLQLPYTFLIGGDLGPPDLDGVIWQCLPLDEIGWHARGASGQFVGIGLIGDFRTIPASPSQWASAIQLVWRLCSAFGLPSGAVWGHGEVDGTHDGSKAPGKPYACPGDLLPMDQFRAEIGRILSGHRAGLLNGISLTR